MLDAIAECPSPNHEPRPAGVPLDMIVLHYTGMLTATVALQRL
jgi:N-acetylmuramoyl-L-alanine amidase